MIQKCKMQTFHIQINLNLNRRGFCEGHKPLNLSNEPKIYGHPFSNVIPCAQPPDSMTSFPRKQFPNTMTGARYPNAVI